MKNICKKLIVITIPFLFSINNVSALLSVGDTVRIRESEWSRSPNNNGRTNIIGTSPTIKAWEDYFKISDENAAYCMDPRLHSDTGTQFKVEQVIKVDETKNYTDDEFATLKKQYGFLGIAKSLGDNTDADSNHAAQYAAQIYTSGVAPYALNNAMSCHPQAAATVGKLAKWVHEDNEMANYYLGVYHSSIDEVISTFRNRGCSKYQLNTTIYDSLPDLRWTNNNASYYLDFTSSDESSVKTLLKSGLKSAAEFSINKLSKLEINKGYINNGTLTDTLTPITEGDETYILYGFHIYGKNYDNFSIENLDIPTGVTYLGYATDNFKNGLDGYNSGLPSGEGDYYLAYKIIYDSSSASIPTISLKIKHEKEINYQAAILVSENYSLNNPSQRYIVFEKTPIETTIDNGDTPATRICTDENGEQHTIDFEHCDSNGFGDDLDACERFFCPAGNYCYEKDADGNDDLNKKHNLDTECDENESRTFCENRLCPGPANPNCKPDIGMPQICDDTESSYDPTTGLATYHYREGIYNNSSNIKRCVVSNSAGKRTDYAGNSIVLNDGEEDSKVLENNHYCTVTCKEDFDFEAPWKKQTENGRYFNISVKIHGKKDCYTTEINHIVFREEIDIKQKELVKAYNEWLKYYELYTADALNNPDRLSIVQENPITCDYNTCNWSTTSGDRDAYEGEKDNSSKIVYKRNDVTASSGDKLIIIDKEHSISANKVKEIKNSGVNVTMILSYSDDEYDETGATLFKNVDLSNIQISSNRVRFADKSRSYDEILILTGTPKEYSCDDNINQITIGHQYTIEYNETYYKWNSTTRNIEPDTTYNATIAKEYYGLADENNRAGVCNQNSTTENACVNNMNSNNICKFKYTDYNISGLSESYALVSAQNDYDSRRSNYRTRMNSAKSKIDIAIEEIQKMVDQFNSCAGYNGNHSVVGGNEDTLIYWDINYNEYAPKIEYSYEEPNNTGRWISEASGVEYNGYRGNEMVPYNKQININKNTIWCNGNVSDADYNCSSPIADPSDAFENETFKICNWVTSDGISKCEFITQEYPVTKVRYVHKEIEAYSEYDTPRVFYSSHTSGTISIIGSDSTPPDNSDIVNGLPVGIDTPSGIYYYKLKFSDIGTYYSERNKIGRIYGGVNSVADKVRSTVSTNGNSSNNSVEPNEYACTYEVVPATPSSERYCVKGTEGFYVCTGREIKEGLCEFKGSDSTARSAALAEVGCTEGQECAYNHNCCPHCVPICQNCIIRSRENCENGVCRSEAKHKFEFRTVSPSKLFPNDREVGYNWNINNSANRLAAIKAMNTIEQIERRASDINAQLNDSDVGSTENYDFEVQLTPDIITYIRNYNREHKNSGNYNNQTLRCDDYNLTGILDESIVGSKSECESHGYIWDERNGTASCIVPNAFCYSEFITYLINNYGDKFVPDSNVATSRERAIGSKILTTYNDPNGVLNYGNNNELKVLANDYWVLNIFTNLDIDGDGKADIGPSWK